jgi:hypothetical protein
MGTRASAEATRTGHPGDQREPPAAQAQTAADYARLADPDLFDERRRLRDKLADLPARHPGRAQLTVTLGILTDEFDRRARAAWQAAGTSHPPACPADNADNPTAPPTTPDADPRPPRPRGASMTDWR